tara:strand:- start:54 stop:926 length:873 start_codon:yes stop_codon:yes gene_type:complete
MKKTLLTFLLIGFLPFLGFSQCVPSTDFTGLVGVEDDAYILEDTTGLNIGPTVVDPTALPNAYVGDAYETFFNMRIPTDTVIEYDLGQGPQLFDPVYINTIGVNEIQGLPMGFSYECASQDANGDITENSCIFPGGGFGCLRLYSDDVPNVIGTYPLTVALDIVAEYEVFGIMIPVEVTDDALLNYLVLVVEEGNNSGIGEVVDSREFKSLGTYPNPFSESTNIHFGNNNSNDVKFSVYDILGNLVFVENINTEIGHNEFSFEKGNLTSGLYTYTISNGIKTISQRVVIY